MSVVAMPPADDWVPQVQPATEGEWRGLLLHGKSRKSGERGPVLANLANAITTLRHAPEWIDVLGFNEFSLGVAAVKPPPWQTSTTNAEWTDHEDRLTADWMQHHGIMVGVETAGQAVQTVARDQPFHPAKAYIDALRWDGTKRIDTWLSLYLGVEHSDYVSAVGARWLRSGIARIYQPGVKADCSLILEGPQGALKSTALKTLADPWFTDEIADLGTKDAALQTHGVWLIELGELGCITRVETDKVKAFMSRTTDRFRPPYGKRPIEAPRQCIFAGSVNHCVYLRDETGARRFWPVKCGAIDIRALTRDRDQLWAEARDTYRTGSPWWLDSKKLNEQAGEEQADRYEADAWQELMQPWLIERQDVSVSEVLILCIHKPQEQWTQLDQNRVARCLRALKWERFNARLDRASTEKLGKPREWRYRRLG
jgi:predicted P-loop ATPase